MGLVSTCFGGSVCDGKKDLVSLITVRGKSEFSAVDGYEVRGVGKIPPKLCGSNHSEKSLVHWQYGQLLFPKVRGPNRQSE